MRIALFAGLALWSSLSIACNKKTEKPTREECTKVAEHIADLIIEHYAATPDDWWDSVHTQSAIEHGIPDSVQKIGFKEWLRTPAGETWKLLRRGQTLAGVQQGIEPCVQEATKAQVKCLLAAKSKAAVLACDQKYGAKGATPAPAAPSGSAGSGSSM